MTDLLPDLSAQIENCAGQKFLNSMNERKFSINTFVRNYEDLIMAVKNVSDTDYGLQLMSVVNKETGRQAHREISRYVHNFVAGSMTLKDHTNAYMRRDFSNTILIVEYEERIQTTFANNPLCRFVQQLRNYMLHKGVPDSSMFARLSKKSDENFELTTGVSYDVNSLLQWKKWDAHAKKYLKNIGDEVLIESFSTEYYRTVVEFQAWLDTQLYDFNRNNIDLYNKLVEKLENPMPSLPDEYDDASSSVGFLVDRTELGAENSTHSLSDVDRIGADLIGCIKILEIPPRVSETFKSHRPISIRITPENIVGQPVFRLADTNDNPVIIILFDECESFGFENEGINKLNSLVKTITDVFDSQNSVSEKSIEENIIKWCQLNYKTQNSINLSTYMQSYLFDKIEQIEVWIPVAYLEVQSLIDFGIATIRPISNELIAMLEKQGHEFSPNQAEDITAMFAKMRSRMGGLAAVVISSKSEERFLSVKAQNIAQNLTSMLRFFFPNANLMSSYCTVEPLGLDFVPKQNSFVVGANCFSLSETVNSERSKFWRISSDDTDGYLKIEITHISNFLIEDRKSLFENSIKTSLISYGRGLSAATSLDRLICTISSIENILCKHELEPREISVGNRISKLLAEEEKSQNYIQYCVRAAYRLSKISQDRSENLENNEEIIFFVSMCHQIILNALENSKIFQTKLDFLEAIDNL